MKTIFLKSEFTLCNVPVPKGYPQSQTHVGVSRLCGQLFLTSSPFPNPIRSKIEIYSKALLRKISKGVFFPLISGEYYENPCLYTAVGNSKVEFQLMQSRPLMEPLDPYYGYPAFNSDPDLYMEGEDVYVINRAIYRTKLTPEKFRDEYVIRLYLIYGKIDVNRFKYCGTKLISETTLLSVSPSLIKYKGKYILMQLYTNCYNDGNSFDGLRYQKYDNIHELGNRTESFNINVDTKEYIPWHFSLFSFQEKLFAIVACIKRGIPHRCYQMLGHFSDDLKSLTIYRTPLTDYNSYRGSAFVDEFGNLCLYSTTVNEYIKGGKSVDGREIIFAKKSFNEILVDIK